MKTISLLLITSLWFVTNSMGADYYWSAGANNNWNVVGNWKIGSFSGSTATVLPTSSDNVFIGNGSNNATIMLNISDTVNDLTIQGTGVIFINTSTSSILNVWGNLTSSNTSSTGGGSALIKLNSSGSQNLAGNTTATGLGKLPNVTINKSAGTLTLSDNITLGGATTFTYTAGTIDPSSSRVMFYLDNTINGDMTFYDLEFDANRSDCYISDSLIVQHNLYFTGDVELELHGGEIALAGDFAGEGNGSYEQGGSTKLYFVGSGDQEFDGGDVSYVFEKVIIDKRSRELSVKKSFTVTDQLTFIEGIVRASRAITIANGGIVSRASDQSHIVGPFEKIGNSSFTFPLGDGTHYTPLYITAPSSTNDAFIAQYFNAAYDETNWDNTLTYVDPCEYWTLDHSSGSSTVNVRLYWNNPCYFIPLLSSLQIATYGSSWVSSGSVSYSGNKETGYITSTSAMSTWGYLTIGLNIDTAEFLTNAKSLLNEYSSLIVKSTAPFVSDSLFSHLLIDEAIDNTYVTGCFVDYKKLDELYASRSLDFKQLLMDNLDQLGNDQEDQNLLQTIVDSIRINNYLFFPRFYIPTVHDRYYVQTGWDQYSACGIVSPQFHDTATAEYAFMDDNLDFQSKTIATIDWYQHNVWVVEFGVKWTSTEEDSYDSLIYFGCSCYCYDVGNGACNAKCAAAGSSGSIGGCGDSDSHGGCTACVCVVIPTQDSVKTVCDYLNTARMDEGKPEINVNNLKVFPTPATDNLKVALPLKFKTCELSIASLDGRFVFKKQVWNQSVYTVSTSKLESGIYIVRAKNINQEIVTARAIVVH